MATNIIINDKFKFDKDYQSFNIVTSLKNEYGYTEKYIYEKLLSSDFERFNRIFGLSSDEVIKLINNQLWKNIVLSDLFEYSITTSNQKPYCTKYIKIAKNVGIKETEYIQNCILKRKRENIDCYIILNKYYNLALKKLFTHCFKSKFHLLFDNKESNILYEKVTKFNNEQIEALEKLSEEISINNIPLCLRDFSIKDIYACLENRNNIYASYYKSKIVAYFDSTSVFIYLYDVSIRNTILNQDIKYQRVLYVPIEFFKTKDWSLVENIMQYSYPIEDKKSKNGVSFIKGKQKNLPFFNKDIMKEVKELLMNC